MIRFYQGIYINLHKHIITQILIHNTHVRQTLNQFVKIFLN